MSKYWSDLIHKLDPYVPGEQPQDKTYIKLNTNENPYPPSNKVIDRIQEHANEKLRLYPDPEANQLKQEIAHYYQVNENQVFVGNGSDEVLAFSFQTFFNRGKKILYPDITYSFYPVYCQLYDIDFELVPLREDFTIAIEDYQQESGGVIFPNPNAPTGHYLPLDDIRQLLEQNQDRVVIIDEAYIDFGGTSAIELVHEYPHLLVVQTFSKSRSLAGLRVGFAVGHETLIEGLNRVKNSFNSYPVDRIAQAAAVQAMKDDQYFRETCNKVIQTRDEVSKQLKSIGFEVIPSQANFLFIHHPHLSAKTLYEQLKEHGILVRFFNKPRINEHLRVSIGTNEEMDAFLHMIKKLVK